MELEALREPYRSLCFLFVQGGPPIFKDMKPFFVHPSSSSSSSTVVDAGNFFVGRTGILSMLSPQRGMRGAPKIGDSSEPESETHHFRSTELYKMNVKEEGVLYYYLKS